MHVCSQCAVSSPDTVQCQCTPLPSVQVAMGVGFIDAEPAEKVRPPRKQVLVVVTASWQVLCFDHNLVLMWEVAIEESLPPNARLAEVRAHWMFECFWTFGIPLGSVVVVF